MKNNKLTASIYKDDLYAKAQSHLDNDYYEVVDYFHEMKGYDAKFNNDILVQFIVDEFINLEKQKNIELIIKE